ncbi:MAG TPA: hypothetical protein G4O09_05585 [Dehalococcoidia bacterium]|nr:hypothetical protein [Dehalococcoidia bacterium]
MREVLLIMAAGIILLIVGIVTASLSARAIEARLIPQVLLKYILVKVGSAGFFKLAIYSYVALFTG